MSVQTLIQVRRGTTSEWSSVNPTLGAGEWGYDTTSKRYKLGDGLTSWNSLLYSSIRPSSNDLIGASGIGITFAATTGIPVTIAVTGIVASQITDFNTAVDNRITNAAIDAEGIQDIVGSGNHTSTGFLRNGTGIVLDYNDGGNYLTVNVSGYSYSGHTHDDRYYTETELNTSGSGGQVHWDNITSKPATFAPSSHNHTWSEITDASVKATLGELAYLSGVSAGTASSNRAVVLDINKDISGVGSISTTGNITVGGNLTVNGTTTTVNSTTVDIGDNIIRVNVSGAATQGGLEVKNTSTAGITQLVWDTDDSRWEFTGGNVYTSGYFIGSLSGNASTVTNGVYTSDSGTVTSLMIANNTIVNADINSSAAIDYSKLNLSSSIQNTDISNSAGISVTKLASSGITIGSTTAVLGTTISGIVGLTYISGTSTGSPTALYNCLIDGGTP